MWDTAKLITASKEWGKVFPYNKEHEYLGFSVQTTGD
jgi:hypothetical protein